ncbi:hypothetical protein B0H14DRAFT_2683657 [Mycena olivaceomarginata]|nr:hypothetical protein B0H14DRAFT_2683657 [Mycena olivaceomarginata]
MTPITLGTVSPLPKQAVAKAPTADWLATSLLTARVVTAAAEGAFPYMRAVSGTVVIFLEAVEKVKKNREDLKELCEDTVKIIEIVRDQISNAWGYRSCEVQGVMWEPRTVSPCWCIWSDYVLLCYGRCLQDILQVVEPLQRESKGLRARFKEVIKSNSTAEQIVGYHNRIRTLRSNCVLSATMDTNFQVHKLSAIGTDISATLQIRQGANTCPPPSRIFQGRNNILNEMHQYFAQETEKQRLENVAVTKNVGKTSKDALQWLSSKPADWMLLFDNADDPKTNLNTYLPRCTHGNILITSRNHELRVYAGANSVVSDMEQEDAIKLLLASAVQETTEKHREYATEIVKALSCLPLAIIQAGAFIEKSGALNEIEAQLLSNKPAQSHDDYEWTVNAFTTLLVSLHHQEISEKIFSDASRYEFKDGGPRSEELEKPLEFLSEFLGPTGVWNSLRFVDVTNELRAYSLINFNAETKFFSIHPLVHTWTSSTLHDPEQYHCCMTNILGMQLSGVDKGDAKLILQLSPHLDSLLQDGIPASLHFAMEYGLAYENSGRSRLAERLLATAYKMRRAQLGDDHPETLIAMKNLASTYRELNQFKEAKELGAIVFEKQQKFLGKDHLESLKAMNSLAITYLALGQFKEAKELQAVVFEKRWKILGEDHLDTLRAMGNLAVTYKQLGRFEEAGELRTLVFDKRKKFLGEDHPDTLMAMANLADVYRTSGQLEKAEELEMVVLEKRKKLFGEDHPHTLMATRHLAITYRIMGQLTEAKKLGEIELETRRKIHGEHHSDTLDAMGQLAATYYQLGQFSQALELQTVVIEKKNIIFGDSHPSTLAAAEDLEVTYRRLGNLEEAEQLRKLMKKFKEEVIA